MEGIEHFSHRHSLIPCYIEGVRHGREPHPDIEEMIGDWCPVCNRQILGPAYHCSTDCRFFIHKSCAELLREIQHPFHPQHPLTLVAEASDDLGSIDCDACGGSRWTSRGFVYHCLQCGFCLDIYCASLMPITNDSEQPEQEQEQEQQNFTHPHPLTLCNKIRGFDQSCSACRFPLKDSVYVCLKCKLLLHKKCAELPTKMKHPFHQHHPLTLRTSPLDYEGSPVSCKACLATCGGFIYLCSKCNHCIDLKCATSTVETVSSEIHDHPLALVDLKYPFISGMDRFSIVEQLSFSCQVCRSFLDKAPFLRCVDCNFNIHLRCFPTLPTVKCVHHRHPLTVTDSPVKDHPDEDEKDPSIEYYCDACEKPRHLFDRTYYCAEPGCHFVAHIDCVSLAPQVEELLVADSFLAKEKAKEKGEKNTTINKVARKVARKVVASENLLLLLFILLDLLLSSYILSSYRSKGRCLVRW